MKLLLVYTPFAWPSAPPLGISALKSYVAESRPEAQVETIDLNIRFFAEPGEFIRSMCESCRPSCRHSGASPAALIETGACASAIKTLKSFAGGFYDPRAHAEAFQTFRALYEKTKICAERIFKDYVEERGDGAVAEKLLSPYVGAIADAEPGIVGFSCHSDQAAWSLAMAKMIKRSTGATVAIGGYFPSYCGAEDIAGAFPFLDYVVSGEGEKPLEAIIDIASGKPATDTPGLFCPGAVPSSPVAEPPHDLDALPAPDFSDYDLSAYFTPVPVLPVLASRGCRWAKCAFCAHRENYSKTYRERSAASVAKEIESLKNNHGARHFLFCDEQFGGRRLEELCDAIYPLNITFGLAGLKPDTTITETRLSRARDAGCRWVYLGVESLTQRILNLMNKGTLVDQIIDVVKNCVATGVVPFISYMWGFPTQTKEEALAESALIYQNRDFFTLPDDGHGFTLEKNSPVAASPEKYGVEIIGPETMFSTPTGRTLSGKLRHRPLEGLSPLQAMSAHRPPEDMPWESHTFWESLLLLAERDVRLLFDRNDFLDNIRLAPEKSVAALMEKLSNPSAGQRLDMARCMNAVGELRGASEVLSGILDSSPQADEQYAALMLLGENATAGGNIEKALAHYQAASGAADTPSDRAAANLKAAECLEKLGRPGEAAALYKECLADMPERMKERAMRGLGASLLRSGDPAGAVDALLSARALDWDGADSLAIAFSLAGAYEALGMQREAEAENAALRRLF